MYLAIFSVSRVLISKQFLLFPRFLVFLNQFPQKRLPIRFGKKGKKNHHELTLLRKKGEEKKNEIIFPSLPPALHEHSAKWLITLIVWNCVQSKVSAFGEDVRLAMSIPVSSRLFKEWDRIFLRCLKKLIVQYRDILLWSFLFRSYFFHVEFFVMLFLLFFAWLCFLLVLLLLCLLFLPRSFFVILPLLYFSVFFFFFFP